MNFVKDIKKIDNTKIYGLEIHKKIIIAVVEDAKKYDLFLENLTISPIKGTKGNTEYLAKFSKKNNFSDNQYYSEHIYILFLPYKVETADKFLQDWKLYP